MEFKIGDKVRIRPWAELVDEYGETDVRINSRIYFTEHLHDLVKDQELTVDKVDNEDRTIRVASGIWLPMEFVTKVFNFKVGDKVAIRPWNSLVKEYGVDEEGDIETPAYYMSRAGHDLFNHEDITVVEVDTDETVKVMRERDGLTLWVPCHVLSLLGRKDEAEEKVEIGMADSQEHYKKSAMQPLEVMQTFLSPEQFKGFLLGNVIKYRMRAEYKGQKDSDYGKARQYAYWYSLVKNNENRKINPVEDVPPNAFHVGSVIG